MLGGILESRGWFRTTGCILVALGQLVRIVPVPSISVWGEVINQVGAIICGGGVLRAAAAGTLYPAGIAKRGNPIIPE